MSFASDTAVEPDGAARYRAEIHPGWDIGGNANGGYLLTIAVRAMREAAGRPDPVTVTAHYLAPGRPGPATVGTEVVKEGRAFSTVSAWLASGDRRLLQTIGTFGDLADASGPERVDAEPPDLPSPDDCVKVVPQEPFPPPFMNHVDLRLHPDDAGFAAGSPSGEPRVRGWFRLPDGEPMDTVALLLATDAFPPTAFNARLPVAWTPTVELTAHVRACPEPGWLRCSFTTRFVTGGFLEEDGEVWDDTGRLVAQSRQLALIPRG
ncbi:MAG TPA: thioesterase family protein [Ilumatobacteraceae bacterium]|nr:thioesterase family protein [Ilumatobacteraceae bacterium]